MTDLAVVTLVIDGDGRLRRHASEPLPSGGGVLDLSPDGALLLTGLHTGEVLLRGAPRP